MMCVRSVVVIAKDHLVMYPTPVSLSIGWAFGSLSGLLLVVQALSGITVAMHYIPSAASAFHGLERMMRECVEGFVVRDIHAIGAGVFFIATYVHLGRGIVFASFATPRGYVWLSGMVILVVMMGTAFLGYVLPYSQMSYWGATVITMLVTVVYGGEVIVDTVWGGYAVQTDALTRFLAVHFTLPFMLVAVIGLHLGLLHAVGSSNPLVVAVLASVVTFHPYSTLKDAWVFLCGLVVFGGLVSHNNAVFLEPDAYWPASELVTPSHIVPEFYFLPYYGILRSVPSKLGGVVCMGLSIAIIGGFVVSPMVWKSIGDPVRLWCVAVFVWCFLGLGYIGGKPVDSPYYEAGQWLTVVYFGVGASLVVVGRRVLYTAIHLADAAITPEKELIVKPDVEWTESMLMALEASYCGYDPDMYFDRVVRLEDFDADARHAFDKLCELGFRVV